MAKPTEFANFPDALQVDFGPYRAVVDRVIDGDTVYCFIDQGLNNYAYESIRMAGVYAPELFTGTQREAGQQAKAHLEQLLPQGTPVVLTTKKDAMSFGRYVGTLVGVQGDINAAQQAWIAEQAWATKGLYTLRVHSASGSL